MKIQTIIKIFFLISIFLIQHQSLPMDKAQLPGQFRGQVMDESTETPLPGVTVMIEGTTMGISSDAEGRFKLEKIPAGIYSVRFIMLGYESRIMNNVVINPGRTTWNNVFLKPSLLETDGATVTAGYFHEAKDAVVSNRSMIFEEIRGDAGGVEDIQRVVQALPAVVSGADQDNEIIVRGGMYGENLFVMDNIEIPNPNHFGYQGAGGGPINMINTYFVRQADFYAGAFPAKYGDKASSVLDISLKDGDREKFTGHGYLAMAGVGLMAEGPIGGGNGSYIASARQSFLDLIISSTGLTAVPHYYNLQGKVSYNLNNSDQVIINAIYGNDKIHIKNADEEESGYTQETENVKAASHQYAAGLTWRHLFGTLGVSKVTMSQTLNYWDQFVYHNSGKPYFTNLSTEIERTLKSEFTFQPSKRIEFNFGSQVKSIPFNIDMWMEPDTLFLYKPYEEPPVKQGIYKIYPEFDRLNDRTTSKAAAFSQIKWHPFTVVTATMGLRSDYFDYTKKYSLDPRLGVSFTLLKNLNLNFACGQHSQSPAYISVTAHPSNRDLDYKKTRQVVAGLENLFREDTKGTLEFFYKDYRDVPVSLSDTSPDPFDDSEGRLVSIGKGYAKGIEFFIQKKMSSKYHYIFSYSYSVSRGYDPRFNQYFNWDFDYRHVFTFIGGCRFDLRNKDWYSSMRNKMLYKITAVLLPFADQIDLSLRWRFLGGRPYTEMTYHPELRRWFLESQTPLNAFRYPAYHRLDIRLDRRFMFNGWNLVTFIDVMNVYMRDNIWMYVYEDDGTTDKVLQFQTLPVGGFAVEF